MSGSVRSRRGCSCDTVCGELDWLTNKKLMAPSNLSFDRINAPSLRHIRRLDQLVDLMLCQVLTRAGGSDCYIYCSRSTLLDVRISHDFCPFMPSDCYDTPRSVTVSSTRMGLVGASILRPRSFCGFPRPPTESALLCRQRRRPIFAGLGSTGGACQVSGTEFHGCRWGPET